MRTFPPYGSLNSSESILILKKNTVARLEKMEFEIFWSEGQLFPDKGWILNDFVLKKS